MPQAPSLTVAIRFSLSGLVESLHAFLAWNLALVAAAVVVVALLPLSLLALLLVPFLAPLACGLVRLASAARRGDHVALRTALPGLRERFWTKVGLAAVQVLLLLLAILNLLAAPAIGGLLAALSMATSVYLAATILAYATVGWTLLCDPRRASLPLGQLARLAIVVVLRRPLAILFILLVAGLSVVVVYNLLVPSLFLPSMVLLLAAGYVLPAADQIAPIAEDEPR